ncbi:adhesion protein FadA, partial [Leptotrichia sp. OH3620_COT-345]
MKRTLFLMTGILVLSSVSYSAPQKSLAESLNAIEAK